MQQPTEDNREQFARNRELSDDDDLHAYYEHSGSQKQVNVYQQMECGDGTRQNLTLLSLGHMIMEDGNFYFPEDGQMDPDSFSVEFSHIIKPYGEIALDNLAIALPP